MAAEWLQKTGNFIKRVWNDITGNTQVDKQIAAQKEENLAAYQRNVEMWNMQNEYNSPAEQMKRYAEAGMNPNLLYGQISSGNASGAPAYQAANIGQYQSGASKLAQLSGLAQTITGIGKMFKELEGHQLSNQRARIENGFLTQKLIDEQSLRNQEMLHRGLINKNQFEVNKQNLLKTEMMRNEFDFNYGEFPTFENGAWSTKKSAFPGIRGIQRTYNLLRNDYTRQGIEHLRIMNNIDGAFDTIGQELGFGPRSSGILKLIYNIFKK